MSAAFGLSRTTSDHPVWQALSLYTIGPADAAFSFEQRLAKENGWSAAHAARVIEEYRRFCFLAVAAGHTVTPSDAVDQTWHLHLTFTRDYWERFCPEVLGRPLHHQPTAGGADERHRHFAQYAETLRSYEAHFGPPPADIWPSAARLLDHDHKARRVHTRTAFILPKQLAWILLAIAIGVAVLCLTLWQRS